MAGTATQEAAQAQTVAAEATAVAAVRSEVAAIVEGAAAQVTAAQEAAQDIAAAAMQAPLAQKIVELEQDAEQWETQIEQRLNAIDVLCESLQRLILEAQERLTKLETPPVTVIPLPAAETSVTGETEASLTPLPSEAPIAEAEAEAIPALIVAPAETSTLQPGSAVISGVEAPRRRTRLI